MVHCLVLSILSPTVHYNYVLGVNKKGSRDQSIFLNAFIHAHVNDKLYFSTFRVSWKSQLMFESWKENQIIFHIFFKIRNLMAHHNFLCFFNLLNSVKFFLWKHHMILRATCPWSSLEYIHPLFPPCSFPCVV